MRTFSHLKVAHIFPRAHDAEVLQSFGALQIQPFAKRLALPDSEINRTHQNPILGFAALGLIPQ